MDKFELAEWLHDNYEELAKANDWQTQEITRVKFNDLPQANKDTMLALADRLHNTFLIIARQADVSGSLLNWMDKKLTERFITKAEVTTQPEITHIKLAIWDFLTELEQKLSKQ